MSNPVTAGRLQARKALIAQSAIALLVALAFLPGGAPAALAAAIGGFAVVLGGAVATRLALGGGIQSAGMALGRLLAAMALKWAFVVAVLVLGLAVWRVPPLGLLAGLVIGLVAQAWITARR